MKIAIATDAWKPQINGVVNTLIKTGEILESLGHSVLFITPESFKTFPLPTYPSIRIAIWPKGKVWRLLDDFKPDAIHIATEGPIGLAARKYCKQNQLGFTTSYHTQFPYYVRLRAPIPLGVTYAFLRWFHSAAKCTMVPTPKQLDELISWNFNNVVIWTRGVDTQLFRPYGKELIQHPRPVFMYMGRVAVEKNIGDFLEMELPGSKVVIGDGPDLDALKRKYPQIHFTGFKQGEDLARHLAAADVFVFPSRTDTFGLVLLEAMACGVPVAAYPVTGPIDVVVRGKTGILDDDLQEAALAALKLDSHHPRAYAVAHSWEAATEQFLSHLSSCIISNAVADSASS